MASSSSDYTDAVLQVISYQGLLSHKPETLDLLFSACKQDGFFYLDLMEPLEWNFLPTVSKVVRASQDLFDLPLDEKMEFDTNKLGSLKNYGYKPIGRNTGVINGKPDGHELFLVPRDALLKVDSHSTGLSYPAKLQKNIPLLEHFSFESHQICLTILACLSRMLLDSTHLTSQHNPNSAPSTSATALIKYPHHQQNNDNPNPNQDQGGDISGGGHIAHTDVGTLTLLFCAQRGLQVLLRSDPHTTTSTTDNDEWANVRPVPGYAVVNVGDSLRHMSGRVFQSRLHRVLPPPPPPSPSHPAFGDSDGDCGCEDDGSGDRFSVIYFLRPPKEARFYDEAGREWESVEWHGRKFDAFRHGDAVGVEGFLRGKGRSLL